MSFLSNNIYIMVTEVVFFIHISLALITTAVILLQPYPRTTNLGWFIGIWSVVIIGPMSFILFRLRMFIGTVKLPLSYFYASNHKIDIPEKYKSLQKVGLFFGFSNYSEIRKYEILENDKFVNDLIKNIESAKKVICISTYIFLGDVKKQILNALLDAHNRGVKVYLLIDAMGSKASESDKEFKSLPFDVSFFGDRNFFSKFIQINIRTHSKVVYIDNKKAWIGSHNLRDEIMVDSKPYDIEGYVDNVTISLEGDIALQVAAYFESLWFDSSCKKINICERKEFDYKGQYNEKIGRVHFRNPNKYYFALHDTILYAINSAKNKCVIYNPYFLPTSIMRVALFQAVRSGVNVEIIVPEKTNSPFVNLSNKIYFEQCLANGIKVYTVDKKSSSFAHSKIMVIDDELTVIGSSNFDSRSFFINHEVNFEIIDKTIAGDIMKIINRDKEQGIELKPKSITLFEKIISNLVALFESVY